MILIVLSGMISLGLALLCTPLLIKVLSRRNLAQSIRESGDGIVYPEHSGKRGTPSMGGLAIVGGGRPGLRRGAPDPLDPAHRLGAAGAVPDGGAGARGVRRRLPQGLQVAQRRDPGPDQAARPGGRGAELRLPGHQVPRRPGRHAGHRGDLRCPRPPLGAAPGPVHAVDLVPGHRHHQRGQPDRRPRRPGRRCLGADVRRLHADRRCGSTGRAALPGHQRLLHRARPAGPRCVRGGLRRGRLRVPVVEHQPGADLHGRHRQPRPRWGDGGPGDHDPHRAAVRPPRRACS